MKTHCLSAKQTGMQAPGLLSPYNPSHTPTPMIPTNTYPPKYKMINIRCPRSMSPKERPCLGASHRHPVSALRRPLSATPRPSPL